VPLVQEVLPFPVIVRMMCDVCVAGTVPGETLNPGVGVLE